MAPGGGDLGNCPISGVRLQPTVSLQRKTLQAN